MSDHQWNAVTVSRFDALTLRRLRRKLDACVAKDQPFLPVTITTRGGPVDHLLAMVDVIDASPVPVVTIALGIAASAGAVLLACGAKGYRFVGPNARVLVHEVLGGMPAQRMPDVEADARDMTILNTKLLELLDVRCGKRPGSWKKRLRTMPHSDLILDAKSAVKEGLADHVWVPTIRCEQTTRLTMTLPKSHKEAK